MATLRVLWIASLAVAALATWTLYAALPGLNWLLWTLAASGCCALLQHRASAGGATNRWLPLLMACVLAGAATVTANSFEHLLIAVGILQLAALQVAQCECFGNQTLTPRVLAGLMPRVGLLSLRESGTRVAEVVRALGGTRSLPVVRGLGLALPIALLFALLLASADPTLARWRDGFWQFLTDLAFLPRLVFFLVTTAFVSGAFGLAARGARAPLDTNWSHATHNRTLGTVERCVVLGAVAAVFALFLGLQLSYLFGNVGAVAGSGMTFAEALHRGFGEITLAVTLCVLLILLLEHVAVRNRHEWAVTALSLLLIAESALLLVSACHRLVTYEAAYGYSLQRLYVRAYILAAGGALLLLAWEVCRGIDPPRLALRGLWLTVISIAVLGYWNPAAWIARANIERYQQNGSLDCDYLVAGLGDDAIPTVVRLLPVLKPAEADKVRSGLRDHARQAAQRAAHRQWFEWNASRAAAWQTLRQLP